jgi:uncharacterized protein (PEP-CTERM system associated)
MSRDRKGSFVLRPAALAVLGLLAAHAAQAADWTFTPRIGLRETYSDNINLAPSGQERSDFVTEVMPGFTLNAKGRRSQFNIDYNGDAVSYARGTAGTNYQNALNAFGHAELKDDLLFLDANAGISNLSASPFGAQANNSIYATNNRTEVRSYTISPYLRKRFQNYADVEARYAHDGVSSDFGGFATYNNDRFSLSANSGEAFGRVGWSGIYQRNQSSYSNLSSTNSDYANASLRYALTSQFALTGSVGYERYGYNFTTEEPKGASWSVGFAWQPSPRSSLTASAGRRFYGNAYSLNGVLRNRYTVWNASYDESVTTTGAQLANTVSISTTTFLDQLFAAQIPDAAQRAQAVAAYIRAAGLPATLAYQLPGLSNSFFLQKRAQASVGFNISHSTILLTAYSTVNSPQSVQQSGNALFSANNVAFSPDTHQTGLSALWTLRLAPQTTLNVNSQYYRTSSSSIDRVDHNELFTVGLSRQFLPKVSGTVELRRYQGTYGGVGNFRENAVSAYLSMRL